MCINVQVWYTLPAEAVESTADQSHQRDTARAQGQATETTTWTRKGKTFLILKVLYIFLKGCVPLRRAEYGHWSNLVIRSKQS